MTEKDVLEKTIASIVPWEQVCRMLDKVQMAPKQNKKLMLKKFIDRYRDLMKKKQGRQQTDPGKNPDSFFPALRIILPDLDRDRGAYGLKEHRIAELYIKILGLKKDCVDAQKLLNYRKPKSGISGAGDFAEISYYVLKNRCPQNGTLSLEEVNENLTNIAENHAAKRMDLVEQTLLLMLRRMSANEQKWLIRVLTKDMHLGIGKTNVFNVWHPDAKDYYDVTNSLAKVCATLQDPAVRLHEIEVSLFLPFRPMLAERAVLDKVESQMNHKTFYVETKYDGERAQIHKNGNVYKYFSRNGFDFTPNFGANPYSGLLTPYLHPLFLPNVEDAILDGEMIGWSKKHEILITKGNQIDVKNLKEDGDLQVCFCAFDLLYLNGEVFTNAPLCQRILKLKSVLRPLEGRVILTKQSSAASQDDVIRELNFAIDNQEEGIVLKDPESVYQPAARKAGWIKVKPDYVDSLVPELDLVIIGGYYGTGRHRGVISHFLLAVAVATNHKDVRPDSFYSFCRIGSGYTNIELENLITKLSKHFSQKQPSNVYITREKPDVWINPEKSCVLQVKAVEVVKSELHKAGLTLRFPRVEAVRTDKAYYEIADTNDLQVIIEECSGKLANKHYIKGESSKRKGRIGHQSKSSLLPAHFRPADVTGVIKKSNIFDGKEFCIMNVEGKHGLEKLVAELGGTFSQNPGQDTFCIICESISVRVQYYINQGSHNVVKPSWILDCAAADECLLWSPFHVFHLLPEYREQMKNKFDEFGDSFYDYTSTTRLKTIMDNMPESLCSSLLSVDEMCEIDEKTIESGDTRNLFRRVKAFIVCDEATDYSRSSLVLNLKLFGATVISELNEAVTHVIVPNGNEMFVESSRFPGHLVVPEGWVSASVREGKLLPEGMWCV